MRWLLVAVLLSFAGSAQADFSGTWSGTGSAEMTGNPFECPAMTLSLGQSSAMFQILGGDFHCQDLELSWGQVDIEIRAGELWHEGAQIGSLTGDTFEVEELTDDGKVLVVLKMRTTEAGTLAYEEEWYEGVERTLRIAAEFRKQ